MDKVLQKEIEILMEVLDCPKDFACYKAGFEMLCRAEDIGLQSFLLCLEENSSNCAFSFLQRGFYFCQCPIRKRILTSSKQ
jgi:hypothetical protein